MATQIKSKKGDELYELVWNFKLMLRTAFPDGIAIHQIESQYLEYVGKKLEFDSFKSHKYNSWADLFSNCRVLKDTFYLRKQAGEQLVKIQKSNISYTKKEIQRVIQLGCYEEHKRKLNLEESEEKPKPVMGKPKFRDVATQVEITIAETKEQEVKTDIPAEIPPRLQHPPPRPQLAITYYDPPPSAPAPIRNFPLAALPTAIAAGNGHCSKQAGGSSQRVLEPLVKQNVGIQTTLPEVRMESGISGTTVDCNRKASSIQKNGPMEQTPSVSSEISGKLKRATDYQGAPQKKPKLQAEVDDAYASPGNVTASDARSTQTHWTISTPPSSPTGVSSESARAQSDWTSSTKSTDSNELVLKPKFLQDLDEQVEADLKQLSTLSCPPREEMSKQRNMTRWDPSPAPRLSVSSSSTSPFPTTRLVPPPAPKLSLSSSLPSSAPLVNIRLNEIVLKKFDPELTRVPAAFLRGCIDMLKGATLFDQPLTDLKTNTIKSSFARLSKKGWCAYLVQDKAPTVGHQLRGFYLGEQNKTYFLTERGWILDTHLHLPPLTLVYGEFVNREEKRHGRYNQIFEIIDAGYLDGKDLSQIDIVRRRRQLTGFFRTYRPSSSSVQVKVKDFLFLNHVEQALKGLWIHEKEAAKEDGLYYRTVTGVQIVRSTSGTESRYSPVFGFGECIRDRYLMTWPPIMDTSNFPGNSVMDPLVRTFEL